MNDSRNDGEGRRRALRLVIAYDSDGMREVARRQLERVLPPSEPLDAAERRSGFRVEVRDADDRIRYVRFVQDPRMAGEEVRADEREGMRRVGHARESGTFAVLVPDLSDGGDVVLTDRREVGGTEALREDEIARFSLDGSPDVAQRLVAPEPTSTCNQVLGSTKITDRGPDADRWTVVVLAEGYREEEIDQYTIDADVFATELLTAVPFDDLREGINVHRVDVASCESGVSFPDGCTDEDEDDVVVNTYFDGTFCQEDGPDRLLTVDTGKVYDVLLEEAPLWDLALVVVNSQERGGSGADDVAVSTLGGGPDVALHEIGHSAFGLADEYDFFNGPDDEADFEEPNDYRRYSGSEPKDPNITTGTTREDAKWGYLIPAETDLPTVSKEDCEESDWNDSNPVQPDTLGLFEGGGYYRCGLYRPQFNCRMRQSHRGFCPVCQERIRETLAPFITEAEGRLVFLRVHDVGTGYGPDRDHLDVEVVIRLDTAPERAFGFRLRDDEQEATRRRMLDTLRSAYVKDREISIEYRATGTRNGELVAVEARERTNT